MSTLAERWVAAVLTAVEMSTPSEIVSTIRNADAPDSGLRAATYEARISIGHKGDSHPERMVWGSHDVVAGKIQRVRGEPVVLDRWKDDDTLAVSRAGLAFIDAISAINASRDAGTADDWDEAIRDANNLAELHDGEFIRTCIDVADDLAPYHETIRAITDLRRIALNWGCPHVATIDERLRHPDVCLSHARIGVERPVHGRLVLCKSCRDLIDDWGDPHLEHRRSESWPPLDMLRALEDGRRAEYRRLKGEWLAAHGVQAASA